MRRAAPEHTSSVFSDGFQKCNPEMQVPTCQKCNSRRNTGFDRAIQKFKTRNRFHILIRWMSSTDTYFFRLVEANELAFSHTFAIFLASSSSILVVIDLREKQTRANEKRNGKRCEKRCFREKVHRGFHAVFSWEYCY